MYSIRLDAALRSEQTNIRATRRENAHRHHARPCVDLRFERARVGDLADPSRR